MTHLSCLNNDMLFIRLKLLGHHVGKFLYFDGIGCKLKILIKAMNNPFVVTRSSRSDIFKEHKDNYLSVQASVNHKL